MASGGSEETFTEAAALRTSPNQPRLCVTWLSSSYHSAVIVWLKDAEGRSIPCNLVVKIYHKDHGRLDSCVDSALKIIRTVGDVQCSNSHYALRGFPSFVLPSLVSVTVIFALRLCARHNG